MTSSKYIVITIFLVSLLVFLSCASDDGKVPPVEVDIAHRAFDLSVKIKEAYLKKDRDALKVLSTGDLYDTLVSEMDRIKGEDMEFTMRWVDIDEEGEVHLYIKWSTLTGESAVDEQMTGLALFVINKDFVATEIMRENPFLN